MNTRWEQRGLPSGRWVALDARNMSQHFSKSSFDVTLEKGLMDAVLAGQGFDWRSSTANIRSMLHEVVRVLRPGGVHLVVSSCTPENCQRHLQLDGKWNVAVEETSVKPKQHGDIPSADYIYVCSLPRQPEATER